MITREVAKHNSSYFLYEFEKERRVKCNNFIDQLFDQQDELQQRIKDLESQLSSNPLQLTCDGCENLSHSGKLCAHGWNCNRAALDKFKLKDTK